MALTSLHDCPAPAKLNLFLHVTGRRPDGYHLLQSVFQLVDHGDTLHFDLRSDDAIVRTTDVPGVPPEQDLIVRALRALQAEYARRRGHLPPGLDVAVDKRLLQKKSIRLARTGRIRRRMRAGARKSCSTWTW